MNIKIETNIELFYRQILELFSNFNPIKDLRQAEIKVLAELMRQNYLYKELKEHLRRNIIFSQENKQEMCEKLNISRYSFNNSMSILRKANIISKDNLLIKALLIFPEDVYTFNVTFKIKKQ
jgi:predicted Zn-dependent protease